MPGSGRIAKRRDVVAECSTSHKTAGRRNACSEGQKPCLCGQLVFNRSAVANCLVGTGTRDSAKWRRLPQMSLGACPSASAGAAWSGAEARNLVTHAAWCSYAPRTRHPCSDECMRYCESCSANRPPSRRHKCTKCRRAPSRPRLQCPHHPAYSRPAADG